MINVHCMLNPARSTHCNGTSDGKSEGNQARPSLNGPVSVLDRYNPRYGLPSHGAQKRIAKNFSLGIEETWHPA